MSKVNRWKASERLGRHAFMGVSVVSILLLAHVVQARASDPPISSTTTPAALGQWPDRPDLGPGESNWVPPPGPRVLETQDLASGLTAADLVNKLVGPGVTVSNVAFDGADIAAGTFNGGTGIIGFEEGIILSSGNIASVVGPTNYNPDTTTANGFPGDADLDGLIPGYTTYDAAVLEFDFTCEGLEDLQFQFVLTSEEYNEYVYSDFNDVFGFFLNGQNIALVPGAGSTPVSINNVNCNNPYNPPTGSNCAYYRNNDCWDIPPGTYPCTNIQTEMDGLTLVFTATGSINPDLNHIKLAIADAGDYVLDSNVFIKAESFVCEEPTGACCDWSTFVCRNDVVEDACQGLNEEWFVGLQCSDLDPPCEASEACCFANGTCGDIAPSSCLDEGGEPMGPGTVCLGMQACCFDNGTCQDMDAICCLNEGGVPQGLGSACTSGGLYAGTQSGGITGAAKVYQYAGGTTWTDLTPSGTWDAAAVMDLAYYNGRIYAGIQTQTGYGGEAGEGQVWRHDGGTAWTHVGTLDSSVMELEVYDGQLFAGTNMNKLYRCSICGGSDWVEMVRARENTGFYSAHVSSVCGEPQLFLGELNTDAFWRYNSADGLVFLEDHGGSCIWDFANYAGRLYAGAWAGSGPIFRTVDPLNCDNPPLFQAIYTTGENNWALESFNGLLYVGSGGGPGPSGAKLRTYNGVAWDIVQTWPTTLWAEGVIALAAQGNECLYIGLGMPDGYYNGNGEAEVWRFDGTSYTQISDHDYFDGGVQTLLLAPGGLQACCLPDGICLMAAPLCCVNEFGGEPMGSGTVCLGMQACCFPDGTCQDMDAICCENEGGEPKGPGSQCLGMQACCFDDGTCRNMDVICCLNEGGVPQGPGTVCTAPEACCFSDDTCQMLDPLCCLEQEGTPQGTGAVCGTPGYQWIESVLSWPPGAVEDGWCGWWFRFHTEWFDFTFTDIDTNLIDKFVTVEFRLLVTNHTNGEYGLDGLIDVVINPGLTPTTTYKHVLLDNVDPDNLVYGHNMGGSTWTLGRINVPKSYVIDGQLIVRVDRRADSNGAPTAPIGTEQPVDTSTWPPTVPTGVYENDDAHTVHIGICCQDGAGGDEVSCEGGQTCVAVISDMFDVEACCLPNDSCVMADALCCVNELGGEPMGPGTVCLGMQACCFDDGTCQDMDAICCLNEGGEPKGPGTVCLGMEACCFDDGTCRMMDAICCENEGGTPQGRDSNCGGLQACCLADDTCVMADALCCVNELGGVPQGPGTVCTAPEACCFPPFVRWTCQDLDPLCCTALGGDPQGPGTRCLGDNNHNGEDDACEHPVPTVSTWGVVITVLLLLVGGKIYFGRRRATGTTA